MTIEIHLKQFDIHSFSVTLDPLMICKTLAIIEPIRLLTMQELIPYITPEKKLSIMPKSFKE